MCIGQNQSPSGSGLVFWAFGPISEDPFRFLPGTPFPTCASCTVLKIEFINRWIVPRSVRTSCVPQLPV